MEKSVFVVECSTGVFDSIETWIAGIFEYQSDAEMLKEKLNLDALMVRNNLPIYDDDEVLYKGA